VNGKLVKSGQVNNNLVIKDGNAISSQAGYDARAAIIYTLQDIEPDIISYGCDFFSFGGCWSQHCTYSDGENCAETQVEVCQSGSITIDVIDVECPDAN
jgi:hypothetical protein